MFDSHVKSLCKKASEELNALSRVAYQSGFNQRKLLLKAFIASQFPYAPAVCMFHSYKQNHHIYCIHEKALRAVYKDHNSSFDEPLEKGNSCKIMAESIKNCNSNSYVKTNLAPEIMKEVFETAKGLYALRNENYPKTLNNINPLSFSSHR